MAERITVEELAVVDRARDAELFEALAPAAADLMDAHLDKTTDWDPSNFVPFSMGENYGDRPWAPTDRFLSPAVESALVVNTLTEDNLPEYFHLIATHAARDVLSDGAQHPFVAWSKRWKAEEDRHGRAMGAWLEVTRAVNPAEMQADRMAFLSQGETPQPKTISELLAYTALQELATQVSHRNTGQLIHLETGGMHNNQRHLGRDMLSVIAGDEHRHHRFYVGLAAEAMRIDPSTMTLAMGQQLLRFAMPGVGIPNFMRHASKIAMSGIYGQKEFRHDVLAPTLRRMKFDDYSEELSRDAQQAHAAIGQFVTAIDVGLAKRAAQQARS